ncbi:hypothetical protein ES703_79137 [subsurface metagenome]
MNSTLDIIRSLRIKRKRLLAQADEIDDRTRKLLKQHFGADQERPFSFELLAAVLAYYLDDYTIKEILNKLELTVAKLRKLLLNYLTKAEVDEVISALKGVLELLSATVRVRSKISVTLSVPLALKKKLRKKKSKKKRGE